MTLAVDVAFALLAIGGALAAARLVLGPTVADRIVASDVLLTMFALSTLLLSARTGDGTFLEVGLVVALLGFVGTAAVARFLAESGEVEP
ncbi:MAG: monovalent cation/H+ antiporter complex subunit F [Acidimicrobiales bacterium]